MKTIVPIGLSILLMCSAASAQTGTTPPPQDPPAAGTPFVTEAAPEAPGTEAASPEEEGTREDRQDRRDRDRDRRERRRGYEDSKGPRHGRHGPMDHGMMSAMGGGDAAHFKFDRGGRGGSIEIKCAADETTQDCVDAILPLLDALSDMRDSRDR